MPRTPFARWRPLKIVAASAMSSMRPLVQEPITTWSIVTSLPSFAGLAFSGRWGQDTVQSISSRFSSTVRTYSASPSGSTASQGRVTRPLRYSFVMSSTGKMPFLPPASIAMLAMVSRSAIVSSFSPSPENSRDWYSAPSTPILPMSVKITSLPETYLRLRPVIFTLIAEGTLNHVCPTAMAAPRSVEPTPVENAPSAP